MRLPGFCLAKVSATKESAFSLNERDSWEPKILAAVTFVLALGLKRESDSLRPEHGYKKRYLVDARSFAKECERTLVRLSSETTEDTILPFESLVGIFFPNHFSLEHLKNFSPEFRELLENSQ